METNHQTKTHQYLVLQRKAEKELVKSEEKKQALRGPEEGSNAECMLGKTPVGPRATDSQNEKNQQTRTQHFVQLFITPNSELDVARGNPLLFIVSCCVACKFCKLEKKSQHQPNISAHKYSNTAAIYTGAPAPIIFAYSPSRSCRCRRPTGN